MPNQTTVITLRFVRGGHWDSRFIERYTDCAWSHVESLPPDSRGCTYGAMLKGGVTFRAMNDRAYNGASYYQRVNIHVTASQATAFWEFLFAQRGKPYDWQDILRFSPALRLWLPRLREWDEGSRWICSTLITAALLRAGVAHAWHRNRLPLGNYSPRDVAMMVAQLPDAYPADENGKESAERFEFIPKAVPA